MPSFSSKKEKGGVEDASTESSRSQFVIDGLERLYSTKLLPIERKYNYHDFHSPALSAADFKAKPQVLMIGQYSVGKTSFIEYILGEKFPGQRVGPEPTTDVIPGNAVAISSDMPYHGLSRFGTGFLNKFEASQLPNDQLQELTIVDTPGILSGEKQRISRGYDFTQVAKWFAERSDLILLLFDAHKLDISDEFQRVIESLKGQDDKIRCVLNKADQIDQQRLMRVYGALMWSMGKVLKTPEVLRVFIGSFWNEPLQHAEASQLFEKEEHDLMDDLKSLPRNAAIRKINEFVKRARLVKVHAYLIGHLREKMPTMIGREKKQQALLSDLSVVFRDVQRKYQIPPGDFPDLDEFKTKLEGRNFSTSRRSFVNITPHIERPLTHDLEHAPIVAKFQKLNLKALAELDLLLTSEIPKLMAKLPKGTGNRGDGRLVETQVVKVNNPFAQGVEDERWIVYPHLSKYSPIFQSLQRNADGKASGVECMTPLLATGCSQSQLRQIWELADIDRDGMLDQDEFALAMFLSERVHVEEGQEIPQTLGPEYIPPSKKDLLFVDQGQDQGHVSRSQEDFAAAAADDDDDDDTK